MDRGKIVNLIREYQCGDTSLKSEIISELSFYIRNFPRMAYRERDEDILSDFYLFFYNRLERVLRNFDFEKFSFWSYLSKCLVNTWYDFVGQNKKIIYNKLPTNLSSEVNLLSDSTEREPHVNKIFEEEKNLTYQLVLKLYFFDYFQEKDLILLVNVSKKSFGECLNFLNKLMDEILEKRKRINCIEAKINRLHGEILSYQKSKKGENDWGEDKQKKLDEIQNRYIKLYRSVLVHPSYKMIGEFWGMESMKISYIIHRFRHRIKKQYQGRSIEEIIKTFY